MTKMKKVKFLIALSFLALSAACQKPYEKKYGLEIDSDEYVVPLAGKTFPVYVYSSSAWTAELESPVDWAEIVDGKSGEGVGMVKMNVSANYGQARSVKLILKSGPYEKVVAIRQNVYVVDYYVTFAEKELEFASAFHFARTRMTTNIPPEVLAESRACTDVNWISGITPYTVLSDSQELGTNRKIEVEFSFVVFENETALDRTATFSLGVPAEYTEGMERVQTLTLVQTGRQLSPTAGIMQN